MTSIDTLVKDINALFTEGAEPSRELCDDFGKRMANLMYDQFRGYGKEREAYLRMSMIGDKDRKAWYKLHDAPKENLSASTLRKFMYGHMLEEFLIFLARAAGHEVTDEQKKIELNGISGSQDCRIDGVLTDVKSASSFGFKKFKYHELKPEDDFPYLYQISGYSQPEDEEVAFLAIDKQHAHICLDKYSRDELPDTGAQVNHLKVVIEQEEEPDYCYEPKAEGKSGNLILSTGCSYCDFKRHCWRESNDGMGLRVFKYSTGLKYFTNVEKEPNVEEVL